MVDPALEREIDPQQQIRQILRVVKRGWLSIVTCVAAGSLVGVALWFFLPETFVSTSKVILRGTWLYDLPGQQKALADLPFPTRARMLAEQLKSTKWVEEVLDKLEWADWARAKSGGDVDKRAFVQKVKERINCRITPSETGERFVIIDFAWNESVAASGFCDELVNHWKQITTERYAEEVDGGVSVSEEALRTKELALDDSRHALEQFEMRNGISAINQRQDTQRRADQLRLDLDVVGADIANLEAQVETMDQALAAKGEDGNLLLPPTLSDASQVKNAEKEARLQACLVLLQEIDDLKARGFTETWLPLQQKIAELKHQLQAAAVLENSVDVAGEATQNPEYVAKKTARDDGYTQLQGKLAQKLSMESTLQEIDTTLQTLPEVLRQHDSLRSDVAARQQLVFEQVLALQPLKDKQQALRRKDGGPLTPFEQIEPPMPAPSPAASTGWVALIASSLFGLGVAAAIVIGGELLRSSFTNADQVRRTLKLAVLGEVAPIQTAPELRRARFVRALQIAASAMLLAGIASAIWVCVVYPEDLPRSLVEWAQGLRDALS